MFDKVHVSNLKFDQIQLNNVQLIHVKVNQIQFEHSSLPKSSLTDSHLLTGCLAEFVVSKSIFTNSIYQIQFNKIQLTYNILAPITSSSI